jgi:ATP-dependent helicase/nuclease subunit A
MARPGRWRGTGGALAAAAPRRRGAAARICRAGARRFRRGRGRRPRRPDRGSAIRHVLVDEFQDTSLEQFELLRALTAGWEQGDGRTLFAVGDPMQSIYQFREAEVGLFLRARDQGIGTVRLESLQLRRNFRSVPALIDWVNHHCGAMFPARDDPRLAAIRYLPSLAARSEAGAGAELHPLRADAAGGEEAAQIVALVRDRRARDPGASIAILVGARHHAAPIAAACRPRAWPCAA